MSIGFAPHGVLRFEIQNDWPDLPNLIPNPAGVTGPWGWVPAVAGGPTISANNGIRATKSAAGAQTVTSDAIAVPEVTVSGNQAVAYWTLNTGATAAVSGDVAAYDAAGALLGTSTATTATTAAGTYSTTAYTLPVGTTTLRLRMILTGASGTSATFTNAVLYSGSAAAVAASSPLAEPGWTNVLGSAYEINLERRELDAGTLTVHLRDADLDPSVNPLIRPGKRWRLSVWAPTAKGGSTYAWNVFGTGVLSAPLTKYDLKDPDLPDDRRTDISVTGTDDTATLAAALRPKGVATINGLSVVLASTAVPFIVNGNKAVVDPSTVPIVSVNENASALDQIAITRDSALGFAWLDRRGILQAWDASALPINTITFNGTFDTDTSGWTATNAALARVTTPTHQGAGALRLTATADGSVTASTAAGTSGFSVVPGASYTVRSYSRTAATARNTRVQLRWYSASGATLANDIGALTSSTTTYTERTLTVTAPEGARYATIILFVGSALAGEVHYFDTVTMTGGPVDFLADANYSDLDMDFDLERCINTVKPKLVRINAATGETEEVSFGPYVAPESVRQWGQRLAEPTVHGLADTAVPGYAAAILAANATPRRRVNSAVLPLRTTAEMERWSLTDLYDLLGVTNSRAAYAAAERVTGIKHEITPDKWTLTLDFAGEGTVAPPIVTPPLTVDSQTFAALLRPVGEVTMYGGSSAPAGWLVCNGGTFSSNDYPALAALLGDTWGTHSDTTYYLPNFTDRFPIGAGTKAVGTSGGNASVVLTAANLPPFDSSNADGSTATRVARGTATSAGNVAVGSSTPVDILNPWRSINFIIRAL
ncbi:phage tail protein [Nocardioides antri]|uniref:Tail fiber protein n=1 Tax=Nocardioides antri TaxID=2607659 RepID=A0A5B1LVY6_9ACTN|nr:tail fiber protein [Nocardioides antri]KAA1424308.1 tail fiber protein [Nocardioides antri]